MKPLRVVIAGAGATIASTHLRALAAIGAKIVGVHDIDAARAQRVAQELACQAHHSLESLLREPADLAVVLTPHPFHAEIAVACLAAGRHVLVEKPIADEVAQADRMVFEARRQGRLLAVALQHRTHPEVQAARELIQRGALGHLQRADLLATCVRRATYFQVAPWRGSWRGEGGGVLINQAQHDLDLLCDLAGVARRVVGWTSTRVHSIEAEDTGIGLVEWPNGLVGSIHVSTCEVDESQRIEITGTAGRLRLLPGRLEVIRNAIDVRDFVLSPGGPFDHPATGPLEVITPSSDGAAEPGHSLIYRNLVEAIAGRAPLIAPGEQAVVALELANALQYSSAIQAAVDLPLDRTAYAELLAERRRAGMAHH
jgi:predicted dehydrogenase